MRKLLRFNIHNLFHSAIFYVFLAILVGWPVLHGLTDQLARAYIAAFHNQPLSLLSYREFEGSTFFSLFLPYVALTFLGIAFAEDYVQDTPKTILARGYSKSAFFFAKWIVLYVTYLVYLVLSRLVPAGVFSLIGGFGYEIGEFFFNFAIYLVVWAANGAIALFFVSLTRDGIRPPRFPFRARPRVHGLKHRPLAHRPLSQGSRRLPPRFLPQFLVEPLAQ